MKREFKDFEQTAIKEAQEKHINYSDEEIEKVAIKKMLDYLTDKLS